MAIVSVVVPIYKVEPYLRRCVDSILSQTYEDFQLILVDDGSPDNCGAICDEYAEKDARVHVIHRENGGLSAARNSGIEWVFDGHMTEWITFIDSDDWVSYQYLERLLKIADDNQVNIVVGGFRPFYDGDSLIDLQEVSSRQYTPEDFWVENQGNATVAWGKLYKTVLFQRIRYLQGKLHEDEFTTFKLLFAQEIIAVTDEQLYYYYQSSTSIMRSDWNIRHLDSLDAYADQLLFFERYHYSRAFKESKKLYTYSIIKTKKEIKSSGNKHNNALMRECIKRDLFQRYNNRILSSSICAELYTLKLQMELYISVRLTVIKKTVKEEGCRGVIQKIKGVFTRK